MSGILPPVITFEQNGKDFTVSFSDANNLPQELEYEIEDEYGRIITEKNPKAPQITLPKLGVGYYHLQIKSAHERQNCLLIVAPQKAYLLSKKIELVSSPAKKLKALYQALLDKTDFHYQVPFPDFAEIMKLYRLKNFAAQKTEILEDKKDFALFLALKEKYAINPDFANWCNCCYDYNKINSYKSKEFSRQNPEILAKTEGCVAHLHLLLDEVQTYLHKHKKNMIAYADSLTYVDYQSFFGWRDRKFLCTKPCKADKTKVAYMTETGVENFYDIFIRNIRDFMAFADILALKDFASLEKNICENAPFPDKKISYDFTALLAILKIESQRNRCSIWTTSLAGLSKEAKRKAQESGIIFKENL